MLREIYASPNYYLFVDTALKKKKGSDYTVMMVIGVGSDGRRYLIDFIRDKMKLSEKTAKILELAEKWRPSVIFRSEAEGTSPKATRRARKRVRMDRDLVQDFLNDEYLVMTMAGYPPRPKAESRSDALAGVRPDMTTCWTVSPTLRTRS